MTDAYLSSLERELQGLPPALAGDILSGIREELRGLSPADAEARIAELGDPAFIAASAREELPPNVMPPTRQDAPWYGVLTVLLLVFGGLVVPVVGWVVGLGFLWNSRTWTLRDKIVGSLLIPAVGAISLGIGLLAGALGSQPAAQEPMNPLLPGTVSYSHSGLIVGLLAGMIATAVYLLVRVRRLRAGARP